MAFKKNQKPWNKGIDCEEYLRHYPNGMCGLFKKGEHKSLSTEFKLGHKETPWQKQKRIESIKKYYNNPKNKEAIIEKYRKISKSEKGKIIPQHVILMRKGKTLIEQYGEEKANSIIEKIKKNRKALSGKNHPFFGKIPWKNGHPKGMLGKENKWGKHSDGSKEKLKIARRKRIFPTRDSSIELKIQSFLNQLHIEFFAHKYISEITHAYQCDIFIPSTKTIIECDGCFFHACPICKIKEYYWTKDRQGLDNIRTKELQEKGFRVIRLWKHEIRVIDLIKFKEILL